LDQIFARRNRSCFRAPHITYEDISAMRYQNKEVPLLDVTGLNIFFSNLYTNFGSFVRGYHDEMYTHPTSIVWLALTTHTNSDYYFPLNLQIRDVVG